MLPILPYEGRKAVMKNITLKSVALWLVLCLCLVTAVDLLVPMGEARVYDSVIRLHVLANSDTKADQSVKLAVRDAILKAKVFKAAGSLEEAVADIQGAAERAVEIANRYLKEHGLPYKASCRWGYESYPTREYENVRLPAGRYLSLRIVLGAGEGENWWCVLFPPLCTGAASKTVTGDKSDAVFDSDNKRYRIRFKFLEWFYS